jgi:hypothetical protein
VITVQKSNSERKNKANKHDINAQGGSSNGKKIQEKERPLWLKWVVGGIGGLTPVVAAFILVDVKVLADYFQNIDSGGWFLLLAYFLKAIGLFCIGGFWVFLHKRENNLLKIFQLGVFAPSLIVGGMKSNEIKNSRETIDSAKPKVEQKINGGSIDVIKPLLGNFVTTSYAADYPPGNKSNSEENQLSFWERFKTGFFARPIEDKAKEIVEELERQNKQNVSLKSELQLLNDQIVDIKSTAILPSECETKWKYKAERFETDVKELEMTVNRTRLELGKRNEELMSAHDKIERLEKMLKSQESRPIRRPSSLDSSKLSLFAERNCKSGMLLSHSDIFFVVSPFNFKMAVYSHERVIHELRKIENLPGIAREKFYFGTMLLNYYLRQDNIFDRESFFLKEGERALKEAASRYNAMRNKVGEATAYWNLSQTYKAMENFRLYEEYHKRALMLIDDALIFMEKLGN